MAIAQRIFSKVKGDRWIWFIVIILSLVSLLAVYSSTGTLAYKYHAGNTEYYLLKHFSLLVFGLFIMFIAHLADYRIYSRIAQLLLILSVPLLLVTLFVGSDINEAKRWIPLPGINLSFQTSDLAKLALIMFTARYLTKHQDDVKSFKQGFLPIISIISLICLLIAPADFSSAGVLFFYLFTYSFHWQNEMDLSAQHDCGGDSLW